MFQSVTAGARLLFVAGTGGSWGRRSWRWSRGRYRAEVGKVIVHRQSRRQGIGRALMLAVEDHARRLGRTTLVLDTRAGDPSEALYVDVGYRRAGVIPAYARSSHGALDASAFYYRLLEGDDRDSG